MRSEILDKVESLESKVKSQLSKVKMMPSGIKGKDKSSPKEKGITLKKWRRISTKQYQVYNIKSYF